MPSQTRYLSRLLGLFLLILAAAELTQPATMAATETAMVNDPALLLIAGMLTLSAGLAIVLAHNVWHDGLAPVVVTTLGWLLLLKGAALVMVPPNLWRSLVQASGFPSHYALFSLPSLVLGAYLTIAGFAAGIIRKT